MEIDMFKNKEYILAVYREGGFTKAAEKLFVSQPSLSATVKRTEQRVGSPIFDRSNNPIGLTDVGQEYVRTALALEAREADFERYISDRDALAAGRIRIGGSSLFSSFVLPGMVSEFNAQYRGIEFEIYEDSTKNLMAKLAGGELDLIIDNAAVANDGIVCLPYTAERLMLAVPQALSSTEAACHAVSREDIKRGAHLSKAAIDPAVFADAPFILLNSENDTGRRAERFFELSKITPRVMFRLDQQVTAYNIALSGMGICFVSDTLVCQMRGSQDMLYYNLPPEIGQRSIYFYHKRNHYLSLAAKRFMEFSIERKRMAQP